MQGTAGTTEEQIRYTWNYAMLIAHGPSHEALIKSPIFRAMESGTLARFEEITRCASEVQDALISLLSEKRLSVPELATEARRPARASRSSPRPTRAIAASTTCRPPSSGASTSSCCPRRRRWKRKSTSSASASRELAASLRTAGEGARRRGRSRRSSPSSASCAPGQTLDGKNKLKTPSGVLSTAEAISVLANSMALAGNFGTGEVTADDLAAGLQGSVVKDEEKDRVIWQEYLTNVLKKRGADWRPLFTACSEHNE